MKQRIALGLLAAAGTFCTGLAVYYHSGLCAAADNLFWLAAVMLAARMRK